MFILLDIDGVMVITPPWKKVEILDDGFSEFMQKAVNNLQKIISKTNASIVLTTSHKSRFTNEQWVAIFKKRGVNIDSVDCLEDNTLHLSRKDEILNWFSTKSITDPFVIIDDDKSLNDLPDYFKNKCVITSSLIGFNDEAALSAFNILNNRQLVVA